MSLIAKLKKLRWMYRFQNKFEQFLGQRQAFDEFLFDRDYFTDTSVADKGMVQESELPLLQELAEKANGFPGPIIEIGTLFGFTTQRIALWKDPAKKLITVDNYCWNPYGFSPEAHFEFTRKILWYCINAGHIEQLNMSKDDFLNSYQGEAPSMVFIDADHNYEPTLSDIKQAKRLGAQIICGHDYSDLIPGVVRAVDECGGPARLCGSLWVL